MFTQKDISTIDQRYFRVIQATCYYVVLQSKNTKHCWFIESCDGNGWRSCHISHTHHEGTPYHPQFAAPTLLKSQEKIKEHDRYHLEVRLPEKAKRREARECRIRSQRYPRHTLSHGQEP